MLIAVSSIQESRNFGRSLVCHRSAHGMVYGLRPCIGHQGWAAGQCSHRGGLLHKVCDMYVDAAVRQRCGARCFCGKDFDPIRASCPGTHGRRAGICRSICSLAEHPGHREDLDTAGGTLDQWPRGANGSPCQGADASNAVCQSPGKLDGTHTLGNSSH